MYTHKHHHHDHYHHTKSATQNKLALSPSLTTNTQRLLLLLLSVSLLHHTDFQNLLRNWAAEKFTYLNQKKKTASATISSCRKLNLNHLKQLTAYKSEFGYTSWRPKKKNERKNVSSRYQWHRLLYKTYINRRYSTINWWKAMTAKNW